MKKTSLLFFRELFDLFTVDTSQNRFPDPKSMVEDLHSIGCKAIWMLDPGIKEEEGYFVYESGSKNDVWIQKADGSPFVGMFR
jgi:alpha-glucosidase (family GH31 glycosyl hydrolase)